MRALTVPNWSFGRDRDLLRRFAESLDAHEVRVHFCASDLDHNRTVTAFSGAFDDLANAIRDLADLAFDRIDLTRHTGVHPRIGALDVCPFVAFDPDDEPNLIQRVEDFAAAFADRFAIPVYLYERSEQGRHEADLPSLRRGGFGALAGKALTPDFGPSRAHPHLGVTVMGVRGFLIAMNVNLQGEHLSFARETARQIRRLRGEGDLRFLGVRALGLPLPSVGKTQISMNVTLPDLTPVDPILAWVRNRALDHEISVAENELIGVIRERDLPTATRLRIDPRQVVAL